METIRQNSDYFGTEKVSKILFKMAPPVMLAQLIQALYNIIDSVFVGRYSESGLTALSIVYPLQLLMIALAVGTGVGINTVMASKLGLSQEKKANEYAGIGTPLAIALWAIFGLNMILATFSDAAVMVLGLYYKWQTFFFIPLGAMQTCIVPVISYNYATHNTERCKRTLNTAIVFGATLMFFGTLCFGIIPEPMLRFFSSDEEVIRIGITAFRIIGLSFIPLVTSLTYPVLFQAVGASFKSSLLTVIRTMLLFVPLAYLFSRFGLQYFWLTYPVTDGIVSIIGFFMSKHFFDTHRQKDGWR